jgi:hypothetical protein
MLPSHLSLCDNKVKATHQNDSKSRDTTMLYQKFKLSPQ